MPHDEWKQHPPIRPLGSWVMQQSRDAFRVVWLAIPGHWTNHFFVPSLA
jgi:hypothetical protein